MRSREAPGTPPILRYAAEVGAFVDCDALLSDPDLADVRALPEFVEVAKSLEPWRPLSCRTKPHFPFQVPRATHCVCLGFPSDLEYKKKAKTKNFWASAKKFHTL